MSGILRGFRRAGFEVGLVSPGPLPEQLAAAVDQVEVAAALSRGTRVSKETEALAANRVLGEAASRLAARFRPDFVYQRHAAFLGVGPRLAAGLRVPLALEWNSSEAWMRGNWDRPVIGSSPLERLVDSIERRVIAG